MVWLRAYGTHDKQVDRRLSSGRGVTGIFLEASSTLESPFQNPGSGAIFQGSIFSARNSGYVPRAVGESLGSVERT